MPTTDHSDHQPATGAQTGAAERDAGPRPAGAAPDLRDTLEHIAGQIGDADRRHCDALGGMQERLAQLGRQLDQVRADLPAQHAGALQRIEDGVGTLAARIADFGRLRLGEAPAQVVTDEPWDAASAEALTRVYEEAETERTANPPPRRPRAEAAAAPSARRADDDRAWLETRLADLAATMQRTLAEGTPSASLAALNHRLDQFEVRLDAALEAAAHSLDAQGLGLIQAHVDQLAAYFEYTRSQLGRLDAIDQQLREMGHVLEAQHRQQPGEAHGQADIEALIASAAERAAGRVAAAAPAAAEASHQDRIEALEGVLEAYIAERHRGEEVTTSILSTIEDALVRIADRVDAMELAKSTPDDGDVESRRLAEAYAAGARVLGHTPFEPVPDAADYAPAGQPGKDTGDPAEPRAGVLSLEATPEPDLQTRQELRASALRGKLKAQALPEPVSETEEPGEAKAGLARRARATSPAAAAGSRTSLLLAVAMALLFGAGYLAVDTFLEQAPEGTPQKASATQTAAKPKSQPVAADPPAGDTGGTGEPQLAPPPPPQPAQRRPATERLTTGPDAVSAAAQGITPAALVMERSDRTASGPAEPLPAAIGTAALRNAALGGEPAAQYEIAIRFADGNGVPQDQALAFAWYQRAAMHGHAPAQFRLAAYLERGMGVAADAERAKVWYRRAAEQGHVKAMHNLGVLTIGSDHSRADYAMAARWFREAAERGLPDSQYNLGVLCEQGRGVARNPAEAYMWFALSAGRGDAGALRRLEQVKARLEPAELAAAEAMLARWQPR